MEKKNKKPSNEQLRKQIINSVVYVERTKGTDEVYFDDKHLRITVTDDHAVVQTGFHTHVFNRLAPYGTSLPYTYLSQFVGIALANDCMVTEKQGEKTVTYRSYKKLSDTLNAKKDKAEYNLFWYVDIWLNCIFEPLYSIGPRPMEQFLLYERFLHDVARKHIILTDQDKKVTNLDFINKVHELEKKYIADISDNVLFEPKTKEEKEKDEAEENNLRIGEEALRIGK